MSSDLDVSESQASVILRIVRECEGKRPGGALSDMSPTQTQQLISNTQAHFYFLSSVKHMAFFSPNLQFQNHNILAVFVCLFRINMLFLVLFYSFVKTSFIIWLASVLLISEDQLMTLLVSIWNDLATQRFIPHVFTCYDHVLHCLL